MSSAPRKTNRSTILIKSNSYQHSTRPSSCPKVQLNLVHGRHRGIGFADGKLIILHHLKLGETIDFILRIIIPQCKLNTKIYTSFILHNASITGNCDSICEVVRLGADPYSTDSKGLNVLHLAVIHRQFSVVQLLFDMSHSHSIDINRMLSVINEEGKCILHHAVLSYDEQIFNKLQAVLTSSPTSLFDSFIWMRDITGRRPVDYAIVFHRDALISLLLPQTIALAITLCETAFDITNDTEFLCYLKHEFDFPIIHISRMTFTDSISDFFCRVMTHVVKYGMILSVKWLLDGNWQLSRKMFQGSRSQFVWHLFSLFYNDLAHNSLDKTSHLRLVFYDVCRRWETSGFGSFLSEVVQNLSEIEIFNSDLLSVCDEESSNEKLVQYIEYYQNTMSDVHCVERGELMCYLIRELPWTHQSRVSILTLFDRKQIKLLVLYCATFHIDLEAEIISNSEIHARSIELQFDFLDSAPIYQFLCAFAVLSDNILGFMNAFKFCLYANQKLFTVCGDNMLQLAVRHDSFLIVKRCLQSKQFTVKQLIVNNFNWFELIMSNNSHHIAELLLVRMGNRQFFAGNTDRIAQYYSLTASAEIRFANWDIAISTITRVVRGYNTRKRYSLYLGVNYHKWVEFSETWGAVVDWLRTRTATVQVAWDSFDTHSEYSSEDDNHSVKSDDYSIQTALDNVELSAETVNWLDVADDRMGDLFWSKVTQLVDGERSRALSRPAQYSGEVPLFETKLNASLRILWTKLKRETATMSDSLLIWCVVPHSSVPRATKQLTTHTSRRNALSSAVQEPLLRVGVEDVMLDGRGGPLNLLVVSRGEIPIVVDERMVSSTQVAPKSVSTAEWRIRGTDFALSAAVGVGGDDGVVALLEKAICCFEMAQDDVLLARAHAQLHLFYLKTRILRHVVVSKNVESDCAEAVLEGLKYGLKDEVQALCRVLVVRLIYCEKIFDFEVLRCI